jgi:hypothetical protein
MWFFVHVGEQVGVVARQQTPQCSSRNDDVGKFGEEVADETNPTANELVLSLRP